MVFINGYVVPEASSTDGRLAGVHIESLSSALERGANEVGEYLSRVARYEELPLAALNTAMFADGAYIKVDSGVTLGAPVRIRFVSNGEADMRPAMSHPRALIVLGERSVATVIESYTGPDGVEYLTNAVSEVVLGAGAHLDHSTLQEEGREALHVETCRVVAASGATMSTHVMQRGAAFVRRDGFETHESDGRVDRRVG
jgi:Fe-S cluster assembly protein SufD